MTDPTPPTPADVLVAAGNDPAWVKAAIRTIEAAGCRVVRHDPDLAARRQEVAARLQHHSDVLAFYIDTDELRDALDDAAAALLDGQENDA